MVKEGNELLEKEIVAFYKSLRSHDYPTARSYKIIAPFYVKNSDFPMLEICYASSKVKVNRNSIAFVDNISFVICNCL